MQRKKWNDRYREKGISGLAEANSRLKEIASRLKPGKALDLAAGDGRNAIYLAQKGWDVTAVDFSEAGIERGKQHAEKLGLKVEWLVRDLTEHTFRENYYDLVCLMYLHLPKIELSGILKKAAAALKPGATLLVVGHDRTNLDKGRGGPQNPDILYAPDEIAAMLPELSVEYAASERRPPDHGNFAAGTVQIDCVVQATCRV